MAITLRLRLWSSNLNFLLEKPKSAISPFTTNLCKPFSSHSLSSTTHLPKSVGTHNGSFHCDEALGCFLLRRTTKFADSQIIRTRDLQVLDSLDAVLDVGGVYDPTRDRFDHHQNGFDEVFGHGFGTKLSSAGLVYKHYGKEIIAKELQLDQRHPDVHRLFLAIYKNFVELINFAIKSKLSYNCLVNRVIGGLSWLIQLSEQVSQTIGVQVENLHGELVGRITCWNYKSRHELKMRDVDAVDNGINQYNTDISPKYTINTYLSSRVGRLNLGWTDRDQSAERENDAFLKAMTLAGNEFLESIHFHAQSWLPARSIVEECLAARQDIDSSGEIMVLKKSCPWKLHIFELEEEMKVEPSTKYVLYEDDRRTSWRVQAVALGPDRFESRKPLPHPWRGLEGKELSEIAGIPGCVFVHMSGFIGGNQTYEGAIEMARASLKA